MKQCFNSNSFDELVECVAKATDSDRSAKRSDANLHGQQDVAALNVGMLWFSALSFITSGIGVVLLIWTFREQRKLSQDQSRPFLEQLGATIRYYDAPSTIFIEFFFFNSGDTPAVNFFGDIRMYVERTFRPGDDSAKGLSRQVGVRGGTIPRNAASTVGGRIFRLAPEDIEPFFHRPESGESGLRSGFAILVSGLLGYEDIFGRTHREHVFYAVAALPAGKEVVMGGSQQGFSPKRYKSKK